MHRPQEPRPRRRSRPRTPPPPELTGGPFHRSAGLRVETANRLRGPAYRRVTRGVYDLGSAPVSHGRLIHALRLVLPPDAVLAGRSAAWCHGVRWASVDDPVEVYLPPGRRLRSRRELLVRGVVLAPEDVVRTAGGATTAPVRTACDLARRMPPALALGWVDALARSCALDARVLVGWISAHPGGRGVRRARDVLRLADPRPESPRESALRWELVAAGLPVPVPQFVVRTAQGDFVARLDLAWPGARVGIEYDGAQHREDRQHARDLRRHNRLRVQGWVVLQVDAQQLRHPETVAGLARAALAGAGAGRRPEQAGAP